MLVNDGSNDIHMTEISYLDPVLLRDYAVVYAFLPRDATIRFVYHQSLIIKLRFRT